MPWRKYTPTRGNHGEIYTIGKGVHVRKDCRNKWVIYIDQPNNRTNMTIGKGRENLCRAIEAAEGIYADLTSPGKEPAQRLEHESSVPFFVDYSNQWLANNYKRWSYNTNIRYDEVLRLHIFPDECFKKKRLDEITRQSLRAYYSRLFKVRSSASVETAHSIISGIFDEAIDDGLLASSPTKGILKKVLPPIKKRNQKEAEPLDAEERTRFIEALSKTGTKAEQLIIKSMLFGGFRLGEALAMKLRYLDTEKKTYHVAESYKQFRFSKPKSGKKRIVDLPSFLIDELKSYVLHLRQYSMKAGKGGEVDTLFIDPKEQRELPYSQRKIQGLMKKICKRAGLRQRNPHDLRHTYATTLLMSMSPAYVQKQLGHSSISITVDIYGHWIPGEGRSGLDSALALVPKSDENCISLHIQK